MNGKLLRCLSGNETGASYYVGALSTVTYNTDIKIDDVEYRFNFGPYPHALHAEFAHSASLINQIAKCLIATGKCDEIKTLGIESLSLEDTSG